MQDPFNPFDPLDDPLGLSPREPVKGGWGCLVLIALLLVLIASGLGVYAWILIRRGFGL